jgi:hypothetical protein
MRVDHELLLLLLLPLPLSAVRGGGKGGMRASASTHVLCKRPRAAPLGFDT